MMGWVFFGGEQEGNDVLVTENVPQINLQRRMKLIDLCKKKLLFTAIRPCLTIFIISLPAMFGTGWGMAKEKRYSCDGNLSFDTSAGKNDNN